MIVDPDIVHAYFQKYDPFERTVLPRLGRTTAYLTLMRDHVVNGFMAEHYAYVTETNYTLDSNRKQFLDMLAEWDLVPSRVMINRVVVNSHTVHFVTKNYSTCALRGLSLNAVFVDAIGPRAEEFVPRMSRTGIIYGYE
jgi:hypothetical protein